MFDNFPNTFMIKRDKYGELKKTANTLKYFARAHWTGSFI